MKNKDSIKDKILGTKKLKSKICLLLSLAMISATLMTGCDMADRVKETVGILTGDEDNGSANDEPLIIYGDGVSDYASAITDGLAKEAENNPIVFDNDPSGNPVNNGAGDTSGPSENMLGEEVIELDGDNALGEGNEGAGTGSGAADSDGADDSGDGKASGSSEESTGNQDQNLDTLLSAERYYAYSTLSDGGKSLYKLMYKGFKGFKSKIKMPTLNKELIDKVFACVLADNPEIFYIKGYHLIQAQRGGVTESLSISPMYTMTADEADFHQQNADAYVARCLSGMPAGLDDYGKIKYLFEYIIKNCEYDLSAPNDQNYLSVFEDGRSVCQGYSNALQYLMIKEGMFCTVVRGVATQSGENHAWNLVKSDGDYYYVDVTWGDASYDLSASGLEDLPALPEFNYEYLCVTTPILEQTHRIENDFSVPYCSAMKDYYYVREGNYFDYVDKGKLQTLFDKAYEQGNPMAIIKCSDATVYDQMDKYLTKESGIFDYLRGAKNVNYVTLTNSNELIFYL